MLRKILGFLKKYGIRYTLKKIICKLYIGYLAGPSKVNRKISDETRKVQRQFVFHNPVKFSILVPLYNTPEKFLCEMLDSVLMQTYENWQLCLADGSDTGHSYVEDICRKYAGSDRRICYEKLEQNRGISENTNVCIRMAEGEYIALFDHDDLLHPSALFEVMKCIDETQADFLYTDEATFQGRESHLLSIHKKPDFCMENLRANNYICHFTVFQKKLLEKTGFFRSEFDGSQDHDLILRLCEQAENIYHIPKVLYFWRAHAGSAALRIDSKEYAVDAGLRAVKEHLKRCDLPAEVTVTKEAMSIYHVKYELGELSVSDITVFREDECSVQNLDKKLRESTDFILLLKSGMTIYSKEDLEYLLMHMVKREVAAVTAKIIGDKGRVLSGGTELSEKDGELEIIHLFEGIPDSEPGYMNRLTYASGIPVICNGCMLIRKEFVLQAQKNGWNLFDLHDWVKMSFMMRNRGYELMNEPRVAVKSRNGDFSCIHISTMI